MPYGGNPAGDPSDAVRLRVGDTDTSTDAELLTDVEYDYFLTLSGGVILPAAIQAAQSLAAMFARQARVSHGPSSVDPTKRATDFWALADRLEDEIGLTASMDAGGISIADKETQESDTDRVVPSFAVGQDDHRGTGRNELDNGTDC